MADRLVRFALSTPTGAPEVSATPSFVTDSYVDIDGNPLTPPTISNLGAGLYGFTVPDGETAFGIIDSGNASRLPRYQAFESIDEADDLSAKAFLILVESTGVPGNGSISQFAWRDLSGVSAGPSPTYEILAPGLAVLHIEESSIDDGRLYVMQTDTGYSPATFYGCLLPRVADTTPPEIELVSPSEGSQPGTAQMVFDVTDETGLGRVMIAARFTSGSAYEVVHDGDEFAPLYSESPNDRTPITGGWRYTIRRRGGWPEGALQLRVFGIDAAGNEGT